MVTTATLFTAFAGVLTARAADSQLLNLVMPDAKVVAGVNVDQAKGTPFGLYVLTQIQTTNSGLQDLITLTGFDPTRDVHEVLAASNGTPGDKSPIGLVLARGNFNTDNLTTLATSKGALTEVYNGVTIIEDPKKTGGIAFLNATLAICGDIPNVKAAIDRPSNGQVLSTAVMGQVNTWSAASDAWVVTTVSPSGLMPAALGGQAAAGILQMVQTAAAGVKFGNTVVGTVSVQTDTAANATQMANAVQFLMNMMQMQSQKDPQITALAQGLTVTSAGNTVKLVVSMPQAQFQQLIQQQTKKAAIVPHGIVR